MPGLTRRDEDDYTHLKAVVEKHSEAAWKFWAAVTEILERRLWKSEYKNAGDFLRAIGGGVSERRARQMRSYSIRMSQMAKHLGSENPVNERQVRALGPIEDPEEAANIVKEAAQLPGGRSVRNIEATVKQHLLDQGKMTDQAGQIVEGKMLPYFETAEHFWFLYKQLGDFQKHMNELGEEPGGRAFDMPTVNSMFAGIRKEIEDKAPYAGCPDEQCSDGCPICGGTGWVTKTNWRDAKSRVREAAMF